MAKFILVDDSKVAVNFLKNILTDAGHEIVATGANGLEGFDLYMKHKPDIITLDVTMPIINGIECLKKLMEVAPSAKAVMVTSIGKDSLVDEVKTIGAKAVLVKPIQKEDVLKVVDKILYQRSS